MSAIIAFSLICPTLSPRPHTFLATSIFIPLLSANNTLPLNLHFCDFIQHSSTNLFHHGSAESPFLFRLDIRSIFVQMKPVNLIRASWIIRKKKKLLFINELGALNEWAAWKSSLSLSGSQFSHRKIGKLHTVYTRFSVMLFL